MVRLITLIFVVILGPFSGGCSDDSDSIIPLVVSVELPDDASQSLRSAASDLEMAAREISGAPQSQNATHRIFISLEPDAQELSVQGYGLKSANGGLVVRAQDEIGAMYGLYDLAGRLGARYIHPEQTIYPLNPKIQLPQLSQERIESPHYRWRGFHEHTQHPTVMSDYLLRPDRDAFRSGVSNYLRWLVRNRQNVLTFHLLNTVDLPTWVPYMKDIVAEARTLGIHVGSVIGFVDQQQNAFRMVKPGEGEPEVQITTKLDAVLATGFDFIGFQIGTSEFTKPDESRMLGWLNLATKHLEMNHPSVKAFAWIHITCGLEQASGDPYYHLPLQADEALGAFVHTTMFYDLENPAPVYDCTDFSHQKPFFDAADGKRPLVYFPETAWWLGFDNNLPHVTPIAGRSREHDVTQVLPRWAVDGHVTFTTGREWTYWQHDHYLTRVTWDGKTTWKSYLDWLAPVYGDQGEAVAQLINTWTNLQWRDFYETNPEIFFYLAGELPQDELGEAAGIIARPPKRSFASIRDLDDVAFGEWKTKDFELLKRMLVDYMAVFKDLDEPQNPGLYHEVYWSYWVSLRRIEHSIALYSGVIAIRLGDQQEAQAQLAVAEGITQAVHAQIKQMEKGYRYPLNLLSQEKPESLTAYPYGYLYETSSAFFWSRRDEQLATLIDNTFNPPVEDWSSEVTPIYAGASSDLEIIVPANPLLQTVLGGFVPKMLVGIVTNSSSMQFVVGQDRNDNATPDVDTDLRLDVVPVDMGFEGQADSYSIEVRDAGDKSIGTLILNDARFTFIGDSSNTLSHFDLAARVKTANMTAIVAPFGIEDDALGELLKDVWGIAAEDELPLELPMQVRFKLSAVKP